MTERSEARLLLGDAAVFSVEEAVRLLPFRDGTAREWLEEHGLVHNRSELGRYVLWSEVLAALGPAPKVERDRSRGPSSLPRAGLRR